MVDDMKGPSAVEREIDEIEEGEIPLDGAPPESLGSPVRHPLEHSWTFWFDPTGGRSRDWGQGMRSIHTFDTIEDFWGLYNNINRPSKLGAGADLHCFKKGIEPKWEDPICSNGGRWGVSCLRGKMDTWWLYTLLAMIGEQFDHGDEICGAVVNIRAKEERISIWTKNGPNEAAQMSIGKQWKEFLGYNDNIGFISHNDSMKHGKSAKISYTVGSL